MDQAIKTIRKMSNSPLAVLTNSSLFDRKDIRSLFSNLDIVVAKLDASNEDIFQRVNKPAENISFDKIIDGLKKFKKIFSGKFTIQIIFIHDDIQYVNQMIRII
jgi:wyosine [tRNA(Phe)-imidazoG37] synthetase (radical SAM superfamily)